MWGSRLTVATLLENRANIHLSSNPRPEFESEPVSPGRGCQLASHRFDPQESALAWLRLMRLPNVFTAIADVTMGYLFVHRSLDSAGQLACLISASALLYTAGMVLNDVFDFDIDAQERPFRPLPSGRIRVATARYLGFALLAMGVAAGWAAGYFPGETAAIAWRSGVVASVLAVCIIAYNAFLKTTPAGPLAMGACRFLNILLGMSTARLATGSGLVGYGPAETLVAAGIGLYIVGVTWFARGEAGMSRAAQLAAATAIMIAGIFTLGASSQFASALAMEQRMYWLLLALLLATVVRRCGVAVIDPIPPNVQTAVKHSILSLIWFDAATVAMVAGPTYGLGIAALLVPALLLGRWVYST